MCYNISRMSEGSPFRIGWNSARANVVPMAVLWVFAVALVIGYYRIPAVSSELSVVAEWQVRGGHLAAFLNRVVFSGVIPWLFMLSCRSVRPRRPVAVMIAVSVFCGTFGIVCEWMYLAHAAIFGTGIDAATLLKKTLSAQFIWTLLVFCPASTVFFFWVGCDFSFGRFRREWSKGFLKRAMLPNLITNWMVWIPAIFVIHAFPTPLQIQLSGLVGSLWSLMLLALGRSVSRDASDASPTSSTPS